MKKNFCKALAMLFVVFMMMNTVAFAETTEVEPAAGPGINAPNGEENIITVTLSGLTAGEEATILVVNDGVVGVPKSETDATLTTLADVEDTDIVYINQDTVANDGTATFELDASNATGDKVDIFCGYTSIEAAADVLVVENVTISAVSAPVVTCDGTDYTGNAFTVTDTKASFTLFAQKTNTDKFGIMLGTEEFTAANIKEKNVWVLEANAANEDGIFAVEVFEDRANEDVAFTKLTSSNVWACAYAINDAGEYVISSIEKY